MKATGIVRRIDDIGRVVIPREIRRSLKILEGDPLELFVERDMVCFKKYSILGQLEDNAKQIIQSYKDGELIITDMDHILASHKNYSVGKELPTDYIKAIRSRNPKELCIEIPDTNIHTIYMIPIFSTGEVIGSVGAVNYNHILDISILKFIATFLGKNCEE